MAGENGTVQAERFEQIIVMQREIVDVANGIQLREVGESRSQWSINGVIARQGLDDASISLHSVQTVQPHQRWTAALEIDHLVRITPQLERQLLHYTSPTTSLRSISGSLVGARHT